MRSILPLLLLAPLFAAGCTEEDVCAVIGERYAGHFQGDAEGDLTLEIVDVQDDGEVLFDVTLTADAFVGVGEGTVRCQEGRFTVELVGEDGESLGTLEGSLADRAGSWSLSDGKAGSWTVEAAE